MHHTQTRTRTRAGSRVAAVLWSGFALGAVVAMIGLGPARASAAVPATPDAARGVHGLSWTDGRCNQCHTIDPVFSHPVGFRPDRELPASFPLQNGQMTCLTCHDGDDSATHAQARGSHDPMLRVPLEGQSFCVECHTDGQFSSGSPHATAVEKAHLLWPDEELDRAVNGAIARLDRESETCLECHDGMLAMGVGAGHGGGDLFSRGISQEHPVGVPYRSFGDRKDMSRMVNPHTLDKRVRLFDGTVGCGSCHSVFSPLENDLVMSNQRSALCLSCHDG